MAQVKKPQIQIQPDIFDYLDYRQFLLDWVEHSKQSVPNFSLRQLSQAAGLSVGFLPLVLSEKRGLSGKTADKLAPCLNLNAKEQAYFLNLVDLAEARGKDKRVKALSRLSRSHKFAEENPGELEVYKLLSNWQNVVIKELAALPSFKMDAKWIQSRLVYPATVVEIEKALDFLEKQNFIEVKGQRAKVAQKQLTCKSGIYQILMGSFHQSMLKMAAESVDKTDKDQRELHGVTLGLGQENFEKAREIMNKAIKDIMELEKTDSDLNKRIYHVEMAAFPMTKGGDE